MTKIMLFNGSIISSDTGYCELSIKDFNQQDDVINPVKMKQIEIIIVGEDENDKTQTMLVNINDIERIYLQD